MATLNSFPNNADEYIGAEEVMRWLHGRTSGVFGAAGNAAVTAVGGSMAVSVSAGIGWLNDAGGNGIVWWFDAAEQLTIDPAEATGTLNRIDRIVVQWRTVDYADKPELVVLKGTDASTPTAPALTNNGTLRQISLARVSIPAGTTAITNALITDERTDGSVCGIVTESVTVDTTAVQATMEAFEDEYHAVLESIEQELEDLQAGTAVELKKLQFNNVSVPVSAFVQDSTYTEWGYKVTVPLTGVIATMIPQVAFGVEVSGSGMFSGAVESYNGGIYLYANDVPASAITIPTIMCWRGN